MHYNTALFIQYFQDELRRPAPNRRRILNAVRRVSPTVDCKTLRIYTAALLDTITLNGRDVHPDWPERVAQEH